MLIVKGIQSSNHTTTVAKSTLFTLTYVKQGAGFRQRVEDCMWEESRVMEQLVLMLDTVAALYKVKVGLFRWTLRRWAAACTATEHFQITVVSTCIFWSQRQVKKQAFWECGDVIQITECCTGASSVRAATVAHVTTFLTGTVPRALLGLLVFLNLCVQAIALLFRHSTKLDRCNRRMERQKFNML